MKLDIKFKNGMAYITNDNALPLNNMGKIAENLLQTLIAGKPITCNGTYTTDFNNVKSIEFILEDADMGLIGSNPNVTITPFVTDSTIKGGNN